MPFNIQDYIIMCFPYILDPDTRMYIGFHEVLVVYFFTEDTSDLFQLIAMVC